MPEFLKISSNGQWSLNKAAGELPKTSFVTVPSGTHTVEVHPHIDQLKRIKGMIQESGKPSLKIAHLKQAGLNKNFLQNHVPKDAHGNVTPEGIDKHIESLPKHKVIIKVAPYEMGAQMHHPDSSQHVISVQLHPETKAKMDDKDKTAWQGIKDDQHLFKDLGAYTTDPDDPRNIRTASGEIHPHKEPHDQIGWARVDANAKPEHWHIDEIQSDFRNKDKIKGYLQNSVDAPIRHATDSDERANSLHQHLSHGHEDPQHMIHSAVNELARKYGVKSTSMDTPEDQRKQSNLKEYENQKRASDEFNRDLYEDDMRHWFKNSITPDIMKQKAKATSNPYLKSAINKINHDNVITILQNSLGSHAALANVVDTLRNPQAISDNIKNGSLDIYTPGVKKAAIQFAEESQKMSVPERDALVDYFTEKFLDEDKPDSESERYYGDQEQYEAEPEKDEREKVNLPVHQINTYNKRPRKLGMKLKNKAEVLGNNYSKPGQEVQYSKLYKKVENISISSNGQWTLEKFDNRSVASYGSMLRQPKDKPYKVYGGSTLTGELHEDFGQKGTLHNFGAGHRPKPKWNRRKIDKVPRRVHSVHTERNPGSGDQEVK